MLMASEVIEILIGPVVMISANGLLCLAFYNRLANVMSRCRAINKERVDLGTELAELSAQQLELPRALQWKRRAEVLEVVGSQLFARACWVRRVLYCLLLAVLSLLACSLTLGFSLVAPYMSMAALVFFVLGALMMMLAGGMAIRELSLALDPLSFETAQCGPLKAEEVASLAAVRAARHSDPARSRVLGVDPAPSSANDIESNLDHLMHLAETAT
jgi:hypothetical protein